MEFNVNITCDSDAFDPDGDGMATAEEIARILSVVKSKLMDGAREGTLRDYNGNTVGSFSLSQ